MTASIWQKTRIWILLLLLTDLLSFLSYFFSSFQVLIFSALTLLFFIVCFYSIKAAFLIILAELFIGSHGYLFSITLFNVQLSLRLALFLILFSISIYRFIEALRTKQITLSWPSIQPIIFLGLVIIFGFFRGLSMDYGFDKVFFDVNAYFFLGLILPLALISKDETFYKLFIKLLITCSAYLAFKTFLILYFYTHSDFQFFVLDLYSWLRDYRIGEFTSTSTGVYRIFMASQMYLLVAWWVILCRSLEQVIWKHPNQALYLSLLSGALIISFSRSFWLGWLISILVFYTWLLIKKRWVSMLRSAILASIGLTGGFVFILVTINFPFPKVTGQMSLSLEERFGVGDVAASSRWNQLLPLWENGITKHIILGSGFGRSLTYISNDPRVRATSFSGIYATSAFEWGYLDIWLKIGLFGLLIYAWVIIYIIYIAVKSNFFESYYLGLTLGLIAILGTNIGSPYLNHPLGIGFILVLYGLLPLSNSKPS